MYTVSLAVGNQHIGSASLVRVDESHGLLTADHVWRGILQTKERLEGEEKNGINHFCMVFGQNAHRFEWPFEECHPFIVGSYSKSHESLGPDLAFIRLENKIRLQDIMSRQSFFPITRDGLELFELIPHQECPWWIGGAPQEMQTIEQGQDIEGVRRVTHFFGESQYIATREADSFDYITIKLLAGQHGFPKCYEGVSGGGAWITYREPVPNVGSFKSGDRAWAGI